MAEVTGKLRLFCNYYVADTKQNGEAAAVKAGYAEKSAAQQASRFLARPEVQAYIATLIEQRCERTQIDADWVLKRLEEIDAMELRDIFNDDFTLKPLNEWPLSWRKYINSFEMMELAAADKSKDLDRMARTLKKIKGPDKQKNLDQIGKHVDVGAWREHILVDDQTSLAERMARARAKAAESKP